MICFFKKYTPCHTLPSPILCLAPPPFPCPILVSWKWFHISRPDSGQSILKDISFVVYTLSFPDLVIQREYEWLKHKWLINKNLDLEGGFFLHPKINIDFEFAILERIGDQKVKSSILFQNGLSYLWGSCRTKAISVLKKFPSIWLTENQTFMPSPH